MMSASSSTEHLPVFDLDLDSLLLFRIFALSFSKLVLLVHTSHDLATI